MKLTSRPVRLDSSCPLAKNFFCVVTYIYCVVTFIYCVASFIYCVASQFTYCVVSFIYCVVIFIFCVVSFIYCVVTFIYCVVTYFLRCDFYFVDDTCGPPYSVDRLPSQISFNWSMCSSTFLPLPLLDPDLTAVEKFCLISFIFS